MAGDVSGSGPCAQWCSEEQVRDCVPGLPEDLNLYRFMQVATDVMWALSGRQFQGDCGSTSVRPCLGANCGCGNVNWRGNWNWSWLGWGYGPFPAVDYVNWFNWGGEGCCVGRCRLSRVRLAGYVNEINEVLIDGVQLEASTYQVTAHRWLERVDGGHWPCWQDLSQSPFTVTTDVDDPDGPLPADEVDDFDATFLVSYTFGRPVPYSGSFSTALLAGQLARAHCGGACELPSQVTSLVRQGVSLQMLNQQQLWTNGQTGLREVDLWLRAVNPKGLSRRASVFRADDPLRQNHPVPAGD